MSELVDAQRTSADSALKSAVPPQERRVIILIILQHFSERIPYLSPAALASV